ncbi:hypothetical protein [Plantactinospora sp. B5E13]|uniref:hypothetical protein n=1 Tax=Plantactinospora sp. B5E13 TaxID=3153758 RepID=UPI00325DF8FE
MGEAASSVERHRLLLGGEDGLVLEGGTAEFEAFLPLVASFSVAEVRSALLDAVGLPDRQPPVEVPERSHLHERFVGSLRVEPENEDEPYNGLYFDLLNDGSLCVAFSLTAPVVKDDGTAQSIVAGFVERAGHDFISIEYIDERAFERDDAFWDARVRLRDLSQTVLEVMNLRNTCSRVLKVRIPVQGNRERSEWLDWPTATALVLGGFPESLIGQAESSWLEVKSRGYNPDQAGQIELAQDVARYANGDSPGLLVLGFRTKVRNGQEFIDKLVPLDLKPGTAAIYHKTVDRLVYPPVRGLRVEWVPAGERGLIVIVVPEQRDEDKPFLVTGAMVGDKCEGAFISIVRRRGEHSIPITPASIHAALSAGRAVLRQVDPGVGKPED